MVKNTHGGSGHKSQARKNTVNAKYSSSKLRLRDDEDEIYGQVLKILGGGMCSVLCQDGIERMCIIRGKFRGRGKRDNTLVGGSWILVAKRSWCGETTNGKEKCDLLEIYGELDKKKLQVVETSINWNSFIANDVKNSFNKETVTDDFEFSDEQNEEYETLISSGNKKIVMPLIEEEGVFVQEEEINVDDI